MKKLLIGICLIVLLTSCGIPEENKVEVEQKYRTIVFEKFTESNNYIVDERSGCLYFKTYGTASSGITVINDEHGKQVGCRKIENVTTVEEYLDK
jgi:hypothetical protein